MSDSLNSQLSQRTLLFGLKVWVVIGLVVGVLIVGILSVLAICMNTRSKKNSKKASERIPISQIPPVSKEIKEVKIDHVFPNSDFSSHEGSYPLQYKANDKNRENLSDSLQQKNNDCNSYSGDEGSSGTASSIYKSSSFHPMAAPSPLTGLPEMSYLGWGHWFTLRDLETATSRFSKDNVLGEGGYGIVYRGFLVNGTQVAVKKLLNNL